MAPSQFNDAEILGVVNTVDEIEVKAAAKAEKKKIGTEAMAYAKMLQEQHKADLEANKALGKQIGEEARDADRIVVVGGDGTLKKKNFGAMPGSREVMTT